MGTLVLNGGPARLEIGNYAGIEPFTGIIDEMALYDFPLTPQEINEHFQSAFAGKSYYGFDGTQFPVRHWNSMTRITEGDEQVFMNVAALPVLLPEHSSD